MQSFSEHIQQERDRLNAEREAIRTLQRELEEKLAEINREFAAIEAYEGAKTGKTVSRSSGGKQTRARRGSRREGILQAIKEAAGLTRGELLEKLGLKGDKSGEMSVSNALTALTKASQVRRDGGKYHAA